jgi:hypothetical protein
MDINRIIGLLAAVLALISIFVPGPFLTVAVILLAILFVK